MEVKTMNSTKLLGIAMLVLAELEDDIKDGKITVGELLDNVKVIVEKLGYADKSLIELFRKEQ